jgi:hypothetical protein
MDESITKGLAARLHKYAGQRLHDAGMFSVIEG